MQNLKYEPSKQYRKHKTKLNYFYESNNIPHIIFYGYSGSKKTLLFDFLHRLCDNKFGGKNQYDSELCSWQGYKFIKKI